MTKSAKQRRPLNGFEWAVIIAAGTLACMALAGYRFFGLRELIETLRYLF